MSQLTHSILLFLITNGRLLLALRGLGPYGHRLSIVLPRSSIRDRRENQLIKDENFQVEELLKNHKLDQTNLKTEPYWKEKWSNSNWKTSRRLDNLEFIKFKDKEYKLHFGDKSDVLNSSSAAIEKEKNEELQSTNLLMPSFRYFDKGTHSYIDRDGGYGSTDSYGSNQAGGFDIYSILALGIFALFFGYVIYFYIGVVQGRSLEDSFGDLTFLMSRVGNALDKWSKVDESD